MKKYSLDELKERVKSFFQKHPEEKSCLVTTDGNVFLTKNRSAATMHSRSKGGITIHEINASDLLAPAKDADDNQKVKLSAEERIERIKACDSIEALDELLKDERAKTVKNAGEEQRALILKSAEENQKSGPEGRGNKK